MSEKRRDHRGRILHNGEMQLSDGRYRFKYVDEMGKERCIYSWRLDHNDAAPKGKRRTSSLREMEKKIQADRFDQIVTNGGRVLGVTAKGATLKEARANAYEATKWVSFANKYMRNDIGKAIDEA